MGGGSGLALRWDHRQTFDLSTSLNLNFNYASNTRVVRQNAIDPLQNTQQITSSLNFSKRYGWGTLTLGGNRRQDITDGGVPAAPAGADRLAGAARARRRTSPGRRVSASPTTRPRIPTRDSLFRVLPGGAIDTIALDAGTRVTALNFDTPLRFGSFNWQNSIQVTDETSDGRDSVTFRVDDPSTADPTDSITGDAGSSPATSRARSTGTPASTCRFSSAAPGSSSPRSASRTRPAARSRCGTGIPAAPGCSRASDSASG